MMSFTCRHGHSSSSEDYCDVCGTPIRACPVCSVAREGTDRYCGNCGYDFVTGHALEPVPQKAPPPRADLEQRPAHQGNGSRGRTPSVAPDSGGTASSQPGLVVVLGVDAGRAAQSGIAPPADQSEHVFMLDETSMMIGRAEDPTLQIPVHGDACVSRRHAEIIQLDDAWGIRDLGSTNGTRLNGVKLVGAEVKLIRPGDVIELGYFSKLTVQPRAEGGNA